MQGRALCMAATLGDTLLVRSLLEAGADKSFQDSATRLDDWPDKGKYTHLLTPLMSAALAGRQEAVSVFLDIGVDVNSVERPGRVDRRTGA